MHKEIYVFLTPGLNDIAYQTRYDKCRRYWHRQSDQKYRNLHMHVHNTHKHTHMLLKELGNPHAYVTLLAHLIHTHASIHEHTSRENTLFPIDRSLLSSFDVPPWPTGISCTGSEVSSGDGAPRTCTIRSADI
jgi:hypothetical protein